MNTNTNNFALRGWNQFETEFESDDQLAKKLRKIARFAHTIVDEIKSDTREKLFENENNFKTRMQTIDPSLSSFVGGLDQEVVKIISLLIGTNLPRVSPTSTDQNRSATHQNANRRSNLEIVNEFGDWISDLKAENHILYTGILSTLNVSIQDFMISRSADPELQSLPKQILFVTSELIHMSPVQH